MARYMSAGELRHQITIQTKSITNDGMGGVTETWSDLLTTWAQIDPPKAREFFADGKMQAEVVTRIRIRYRPYVNHTCRIKYGSRIFNITSVINPDEANQELILMAREEFVS